MKKYCVCAIIASLIALPSRAFAEDEDVYAANAEYPSCDIDGLSIQDPENLSATFEAVWAKCPANSYCENGEPVSCPQEYPMSVEGTASRNDCFRPCSIEAGDFEPGTLGITGNVYYDGRRTCAAQTCHEGYYIDGTECSECPPGYTTTEGTSATSCDPRQVSLEYVNSLDHEEKYNLVPTTCTYGSNSSFTLPSKPATAPEGKVFAGWRLVEPENEQGSGND